MFNVLKFRRNRQFKATTQESELFIQEKGKIIETETFREFQHEKTKKSNFIRQLTRRGISTFKTVSQ